MASTVLSQRREQKIAPLLEPGDAVLADAKLGRDARLGELPRLAQLAQGHFLGDELGRPLLDLAASLGVEPRHHGLKAYGHRGPYMSLNAYGVKCMFGALVVT